MSLLQDFLDLRPMGGFEMIMADPPWSFENFSEAGEGRNPKAHYGCLPLEAIAAIPVSSLAARDAVLFLWATNPMVPEALVLMRAWGFSFKTMGTWVKRTARGKDAFGTGYCLRSSNEPFLIGTRGQPRPARNVRSTVASYDRGADLRPGAGWPETVVTIEARTREHSRKPDEAFAAAEALLPDARHRIELFSRETRPGWAAWGNETGKFDGEGAIEGTASPGPVAGGHAAGADALRPAGGLTA